MALLEFLPLAKRTLLHTSPASTVRKKWYFYQILSFGGFIRFFPRWTVQCSARCALVSDVQMISKRPHDEKVSQNTRIANSRDQSALMADVLRSIAKEKKIYHPETVKHKMSAVY